MGPNVAGPERPVRVRKLALDLRPIEQRLERGIDRLRLFLQVGEERALVLVNRIVLEDANGQPESMSMPETQSLIVSHYHGNGTP